MLSTGPYSGLLLHLLSFTAESDRDKRDWMEALQEAIAETLSDYEVAEKIWSNRSNRTCADCKALNPDWASINLCVVICKNCAGRTVCGFTSAWNRELEESNKVSDLFSL